METTPLFKTDMLIPKQAAGVRLVPNSAAQSSLFSIGSKGLRQQYKDLVLVSGAGITITYTGEELRSDDLDVFMGILHFARGMSSDTSGKPSPVNFVPRQLLQLLDWNLTGAYYEKLTKSVERLQHTAVKIKFSDGNWLRGPFVNLIRGSDVNSRQWQVSLSHEIIQWIAVAPMLVDWEERKRLTRPLAKWLHSFARSFPESMSSVCRVPEATLMVQCGSTAKRLSSFRETLRDALTHMQEERVIFGYEIHDGVVYIALKEDAVIVRESAAAIQQFELSFKAGA